MEARDEASRILLNARVSHANDVDNDRVGHRHEVREPARCCLSQRRGRARGASGRRVARVDAILYTIRQFLFFRSLCVLDVFLSRPFSRRLLRARVSKDSRTQSRTSGTLMILPQVHLRKPCYDFYFL